MNFALISFPEEDDSLGVIPTNWITSSGHSCYYPCVISDFAKNKLIFTRHEPGNDWVEVEIKILRKFETYKTAKSHLTDAETAYSTGISDGNSESKTRSIRASKRPRKKKKIVLPGESSSSDDEMQIKKKFANPPNSSPPSSSSDYEFTKSSATNTHLSLQTSPKLTDLIEETLLKLPRCSVQLSATLKNHVQVPPKLVNGIEHASPIPTKNIVETPPTPTNNTVQSPSTLTNNAVQSPSTLTNSSVQTPPTPTNNIVQTPPTPTNNTVETPPTLTNNALQSPPTLTNQTAQTPPTLTNYTLQTPTTLKPLLEPFTPSELHSDSPITNKSPTVNQKKHKPKFKGLLRPVSPSSCGSTSLLPSQPIHVNVNTRSRSVEEAPAISSPLSSPGSSSSSTSIKSEILSLRQNQEMMWVVLGEISQKLDSIMGSLGRLESRSDVVFVPETNVEDGVSGWLPENICLSVNFPLNNRIDFCEFEEKLCDSTFRLKMLNFFNDRSGNTIRSLVAGVMRKLLTDELAEEYSLTGKSGTKKAFDNTRSFSFVCQICLRKFVGGEEREIREGVSDWLMQAKFRRQRRMKRSAGLNERREQSITFTELNM